MIVLPAGGQSARFKAKGILTPKFMLPLAGQTVFDHVLKSFEDHYTTEDFLIITAQRRDDIAFFKEAMARHGIRSFDIVTLPPMPGMMPAVHEGLRQTRFSLDQSLLIHVADVFRHHFDMPRPNTKTLTADFVPAVTNVPRTGLSTMEILMHGKGIGCYHVSSARDFADAYEKSRSRLVRSLLGEKAMEVTEGLRTLFHLRQAGYHLTPRLIPAHHATDCGTPDRYRDLRRMEFKS